MIRIQLPENVARLVDHYAKVYKVTELEATNRLLSGLETMLVERISLVEIGRDWQRIARELLPDPETPPVALVAGSDLVENEEAGGSTIVPLSETSPVDDGNLPALEVSRKLASGYVGVYSHTRGWRAQVPIFDAALQLHDDAPPRPAGMKFLRTRETPIQAAIDRRAYLLAHDQPYGPLAETIAWLRTRHPEMTEAQLRKEAEELDALKPPA